MTIIKACLIAVPIMAPSVALGFGPASTLEGPGSISVSVGPTGTVAVGEVITVTVRINGYNEPTEIDGYNFDVTFDGAFLSFVEDSLDFGIQSGEAWLTQPNQETGDGFFFDTSGFSSSADGVVTIAVYDGQDSSPERGTVGESGLLARFDLMAIAEGMTNITPEAFGDGSVLLDTQLVTAGVPILAPASVIIANDTPEPDPDPDPSVDGDTDTESDGTGDSDGDSNGDDSPTAGCAPLGGEMLAVSLALACRAVSGGKRKRFRGFQSDCH